MRLNDAIVTNLDAAEQAALAAGLGIRWAELPGDTPDARATALIEALARAGRAADLSAALALARPAVPWAELPYPAATHRRLHAALCRRHSLDSLRTLCFRLGLDYDDLPGDTKSARARELVLAMERLGRLDELLARPETHKPGYDMQKPGREWSRTRSFHLVRLLLVALILLLPVADGRLPGVVEQGGGGGSEGEQGDGGAGENDERRTTSAAPETASHAPETAGHAPEAASHAPETAGHGQPPAPAAGAPAPLAQSPTPHAPSPPPAFVLVGDRGANLRAGPGPEYPVVVTLRAGARLALRAVSPSGEWYQVRYPGHGSPWIDAAYAVVPGGVGGLPVATVGSRPAAEATVGSRPAVVAGPTAGPARATPVPPPPSPSPIPTAAVPTPGVPTPGVPTATAPPP